MAIKHFHLHKIRLKTVGKGQLPDPVRYYLTDVPPLVGYSRNHADAYVAGEEEARQLSELLDVRMEEIRGGIS